MKSPIDRYTTIPNKLFIENRRKLAKNLLPNALVVIQSNDIMPTGSDGVMPFRQNNDLFYLSGINQEETILLLYPNASNKQQQTMLFIKKTTPEIAIWEGSKYTKEGAKQCSGIDEIHWLEAFPTIFHSLMRKADYVYLYADEHMRSDMLVQTRNSRFTHWCKERYPLHTYKRLAPIMQELRMIKSEIEIDLIRKAYAITEKGFRKMLPLVRPGIIEYTLEASLISTFIQEGSSGFAYSPIIASGFRSCILHYTANNSVCDTGEVILFDVGAVYANYSADVTRVVPVDGKFTSRQKAVYKAVLTIFEQAKKLLVVGGNFTVYNRQIGQLMEQALINLGLLRKHDIQKQNPLYPSYKKYFMHNTSHHLGLSTHDVADLHKPFSPGMVLTIEPAIYIPEEGFGIRLENAVVLRKDSVEDLTPNLPLEPESIEALMHQ